MKLLLTGGHVTPAYAFAEYAINQGDTLLYISSEPVTSVESNEVQRLGVPYLQLKSVKFNRYHKFQSLLTAPRFFHSLLKSIRIIRRERPTCVVTFGSFNAVPVAYAAKLLGVPVVLHEQTRVIGLANRLIAPIAAACAVSYKETCNQVKPDNCHVTGNLIRHSMWKPPRRCPFAILTKRPILFITGGNQGSAAINSVIFTLLKSLSTQYEIFWQVGKWRPAGKRIPATITSKPWFNPRETSWLLRHAHLVISRAGANTIAEIAIAGTPSITIPLPLSSGDEQAKNAQLIADQGASITIAQSLLTPKSLQAAIETIELDYTTYRQKAKQLVTLQNPHAVADFYQLVKQYAKK